MIEKRSGRTDRTTGLEVTGIVLHRNPDVYLTALPGPWLLDHSTPSWRIDDPQKGFQRIVKDQRAKEIARTVLDTHRSFPNAITLATTAKSFAVVDNMLELPSKAKFLVVDGQHRLLGAALVDHSIQLPVVLLPHASWVDQVFQFVLINEAARKVDTSLLTDIFGNSLTPDEQEDLAARPVPPED